MEERLKVIYNDVNGINSELDDALRKLLKNNFGYEFMGSGILIETGERDLGFVKINKKCKYCGK